MLTKLFTAIVIYFFIASQGLAADMSNTNVQINFLPKNITIWILDAKEEDVVYLDAKNKPKDASRFMNNIILTFDGDFYIKIKNTTIKSNRNYVYINDIPMNNEINAVVSKDGNVHRGSFIRSFD